MPTTRYSIRVKGNKSNYFLDAQFDLTSDGYLGITQDKDRVLLTPDQIATLVKFLGSRARNVLDAARGPR
jgi:hypothetical protein